eukprot:6799474-Alexandrium_andersonii.AAC.1
MGKSTPKAKGAAKPSVAAMLETATEAASPAPPASLVPAGPVVPKTEGPAQPGSATSVSGTSVGGVT